MHIRETARGPVLVLDDGSPVRITRPEATIMIVLMPGAVCSARALADAIWGGNAKEPPSWREAVGAYVSRLRKIGVEIVNAPGRGYALRKEIENV